MCEVGGEGGILRGVPVGGHTGLKILMPHKLCIFRKVTSYVTYQWALKFREFMELALFNGIIQ